MVRSVRHFIFTVLGPKNDLGHFCENPGLGRRRSVQFSQSVSQMTMPGIPTVDDAARPRFSEEAGEGAATRLQDTDGNTQDPALPAADRRPAHSRQRRHCLVTA